MIKLTPTQVKEIERCVDRSNLSILRLKEDIIDHLCCSVEQKLEQGFTFEASVEEALTELSPDGLDVLEHETLMLLHSKYIPMKRIIYLLGLLTTISMSIGFTFWLLGWPGGHELSTFGFLTFALIFLPVTAYNNLKQRSGRTFADKAKILLGFTSGAVTGVAVFFKMMHYPWVDILLLTGAITFSFGFLPVLFYTLYLKSTKITT
jgi:hypothetical protein